MGRSIYPRALGSVGDERGRRPFLSPGQTPPSEMDRQNKLPTSWTVLVRPGILPTSGTPRLDPGVQGLYRGRGPEENRWRGPTPEQTLLSTKRVEYPTDTPTSPWGISTLTLSPGRLWTACDPRFIYTGRSEGGDEGTQTENRLHQGSERFRGRHRRSDKG